MDPVHAVLIPPQLERFRRVTGIGAAPLAADFEGWHKLVLLAPDRVFLFPRYAQHVDSLVHELAAYDALAAIDAPVPRLLARYDDPAIYPYPFAAVSRLGGVPYSRYEESLGREDVGAFLERLGEVVAAWHEIPVTSLSPVLHEPALDTSSSFGEWTRQVLVLGAVEEAVVAAVERLPARVVARDAWLGALRELAGLGPVLVHGDVHESQVLLADGPDGPISGVIDWETARVDHPLYDFEFGEWGTGIWAWRRDFAGLRARMWDGYRSRRASVLPDAALVHLLFSLRHLMWVIGELDRGRAPNHEVVGTVDENIATVVAATAALTSF